MPGLFWDWEHPMRTGCIARRPDFTLEATSKEMMLLIDMACQNEYDKIARRDKKIGKQNQLCFELRERREGYMVKVISAMIVCHGGGMKKVKEYQTNVRIQ